MYVPKNNNMWQQQQQKTELNCSLIERMIIIKNLPIFSPTFDFQQSILIYPQAFYLQLVTLRTLYA